MDMKATPIGIRRWEANTPQSKLKAHARRLLDALDDSDIRRALAGKSTLHDWPYETYLLAPLESAVPPLGRIALNALANGQPARAADVADLLHSLRRDFMGAAAPLEKLPEGALEDLTTGGGQPRYQHVTPDHPNEIDYFALRKGLRSSDPATYGLDVAEDLRSVPLDESPRYYTAKQQQQMAEKFEQLRADAAIVLGTLSTVQAHR